MRPGPRLVADTACVPQPTVTPQPTATPAPTATPLGRHRWSRRAGGPMFDRVMRAGCASVVFAVLALGCATSHRRFDGPAASPGDATTTAGNEASGRGSDAERPAQVFHFVAPGETLYRIAKRFGVSVEALASANDITDVTRLTPGRRLLIPTPGAIEARPGTADKSTRAGEAGPQNWAWPLAGPIGSRFGDERGHSGRPGSHTGIDILAKPGTAITASADGQVVFADHRGSYGLLVVLEHTGGFRSYYAHLAQALVEVGAVVRRGDLVGRCGQTGNATGPHLHFEIRQDDTPLDPLTLLGD